MGVLPFNMPKLDCTHLKIFQTQIGTLSLLYFCLLTHTQLFNFDCYRIINLNFNKKYLNVLNIIYLEY